MTGTDAQRAVTVPGEGVAPGLVIQVLRLGTEDHHVVAFEGASPLMTLSWLVLLAGWTCLPAIREGQMYVERNLRKERKCS